MDIIHSQIDKNSKEFKENYAFHQNLFSLMKKTSQI